MELRFNERKVTQAAARFAKREGGTINYMKLLKLLYLADRAAIDQYGSPITGDSYRSMKQGPVLSSTLDVIKGNAWGLGEIWSKTFTSPLKYEITLVKEPAQVLCEADEEIIDAVYAKYGHLNQWDLVRYCHAMLPEWRQPAQDDAQKCTPIEYEDILKALKKTDDERARILSALSLASKMERYQSNRS